MNSLIQTPSSYPAAHSQSSANYEMEYGLVMWILRSVKLAVTILGIVTMLDQIIPISNFWMDKELQFMSLLHNMLPFCELLVCLSIVL